MLEQLLRTSGKLELKVIFEALHGKKDTVTKNLGKRKKGGGMSATEIMKTCKSTSKSGILLSSLSSSFLVSQQIHGTLMFTFCLSQKIQDGSQLLGDK